MAVFSATTSSNQYISLELETRVEGQSTASNTTTLSWWLRVRKSGSSTSDTWGNCSYSANIGGNVYNGSAQVRVSPGGATELLSGAVTVAHNSEGKLTLVVSGSISGKISGSVSGSQPLEDIARASTLDYASRSGFQIGEPITFCAKSASSAYTHSLTITFGSYKTTILSYVPGGKNYDWTPPMELCSQIPSNSAGTATLKLYTWTDSTGQVSVGTREYVVTLYAPNDVIPAIHGVSVAETVSGLDEQFGAFIAGKSRLGITVNAEGSYGSTLTACEVKVGGVTYTGTSITTDTLTRGMWSIEVKVTDTRGRWTTNTYYVTLEDYSSPAISRLEVHRCGKDGTYQDDGDYVSIAYSYTITPVNRKNTHSAIVEYKRVSSTDWQTLLSFDDYAADKSVVPTTQLSSDYQYDLRLTVTDYFSESTMTAALPSAEVILDLLATGNGLAVGKTSEWEERLDSAWSLRIQDSDLADFVVEQGNDSTWSWRKWKSGVAECWAQVNVPYANSSVLTRAVSLPFTFASVTCCTATLNNYNENAASALPWNCKVQFGTGAAHVAVHSTSGNFSSGTTLPVSVRLEGYWK